VERLPQRCGYSIASTERSAPSQRESARKGRRAEIWQSQGMRGKRGSWRYADLERTTLVLRVMKLILITMIAKLIILMKILGMKVVGMPKLMLTATMLM